MARKPRLHFSGAIYHVSLRGNGSQRIFTSATDCTRLLLLCQEGVEKFGHKIHAFALLPTELRLVIEADEIPLSRIMQQLGFRYTRWYNDFHQQAGHLFQGRYKAILIDPEAYLFELVRDLHLAPVREGLETDPMRYPWSSHRAYCGREKVLWLTTDRTFLNFEETGIRALMKFHAEINEGMLQPPSVDFYTGADYDPRVLGDADFARGALKLARQPWQPVIDPNRIMDIVLQQFKLTEEDLAAAGKNRQCATARAYLGWLCLETGAMTLTALADRLRRDVSSLSSSIRRLQIKSKKDPAITDLYQNLRKKL